ncbi:hypothetical protein QMK17_13315 [Rhodococcus sp. G-MC3]|uniref:hypothetical protein n=1 Tax=Rhodococcus sp. G-MC3 TaxID=3046209 RepID=UPI0024B949E6|nr:hypothetical protein [Rhodococcus sp. G-MC3]MDJ0394306.1 hypothetical protein [Rhodococcus sp. G-MC3]
MNELDTCLDNKKRPPTAIPAVNAEMIENSAASTTTRAVGECLSSSNFKAHVPPTNAAHPMTPPRIAPTDNV